jgi:hypothetical protein
MPLTKVLLGHHVGLLRIESLDTGAPPREFGPDGMSLGDCFDWIVALDIPTGGATGTSRTTARTSGRLGCGMAPLARWRTMSAARLRSRCSPRDRRTRPGQEFASPLEPDEVQRGLRTDHGNDLWETRL